MKVVILCGGIGTRLMEETETKPKPMIDIGKKPILWHIMKMYSTYGFNDFVLAAGYKGEMIKHYFFNYDAIKNDFTIELGKGICEVHKNHSEKGWKVTIVDTGESALKGCRIKRIERFIDSDIFMLTYGDGLADINLSDLLAFHKKHGKIGTVTGVRPPSRFGEMIVDMNKVISFTEKPQLSQGMINGGFFVFNRKIFNYLFSDEKCDFEVGPLEQLAKDGELMVYEHKGNWTCMDTQRDMIYLNSLWNSNRAFWKIWDD